MPYIETSAATGDNIKTAVNKLIDLVMKRMEQCIDKSWFPKGTVPTTTLLKRRADMSKSEKSSCPC